METFERQLDRALGMLPFDCESLVARAVVEGRRIQRRRRIAAGAGVVALGALALLPGAALLRGGHDGQASDHPAGRVLIGTQPASAHLAALLPGPSHERSVVYYNPLRSVIRTYHPDSSGGGTLELTLAPGLGTKGGSRPPGGRPLTEATVNCAGMHRSHVRSGKPWGDDCLIVPGGWIFTSTTGVPSARMGAVDWEVKFVDPNDDTVALTATNHLPGHHPTRRDPVLSFAQLEHLVQDPGWFRPAS